jgi:catechol 2,3-dioxygenase-like lactoylglutathione lyase family enzyme
MPPVSPRAIGEIAIRCADPVAMAAFYENVIGLAPMARFADDRIIFLKVGEGFAGHTAVLALFHHDMGGVAVPPGSAMPPATGAGSSLHHLALSMTYADQQRAMDWFDSIGQPWHVEHFGWIGWRGVFTHDPEGNTVELVAYDAGEMTA